MAGAQAASADSIDELLAGNLDPVSFDYGTLRDRPDAEAFLAMAETRVQRAILSRQGVADNVAWNAARLTRCMTEPELAMLKGVASAQKAGTSAAWRAARAEADVLAAKRRELRARLFAGEVSPHPELRGVQRRLKLARDAGDPALAELFRRSADDNFARALIMRGSRPFWAPDASLAALDLDDAAAMRALCLADEANQAWLKTTIAKRGWFRISRDGEEADAAAWLIAQHADYDPAFQQEILGVLEDHLANEDTDASGYAYLYDRVAVNTGRLQRYATQGYCAAPGEWLPDPLEDPGGVEARRTAMGVIPSLAEYRVLMSSYCP
ncbi:MAG TPA: hypothetical protein PLF78_13505 [Caulobacter sp.]|nr:hypothetical protein [Caulobacter sp.]